MSNFLNALIEKRPELELKVKDFEHPLDKQNKYFSLYINGIDSRFILPETELNIEDPQEINELVDITLMYINKNGK
jgi:hypothetical protein